MTVTLYVCELFGKNKEKWSQSVRRKNEAIVARKNANIIVYMEGKIKIVIVLLWSYCGWIGRKWKRSFGTKKVFPVLSLFPLVSPFYNIPKEKKTVWNGNAWNFFGVAMCDGKKKKGKHYRFYFQNSSERKGVVTRWILYVFFVSAEISRSSFPFFPAISFCFLFLS